MSAAEKAEEPPAPEGVQTMMIDVEGQPLHVAVKDGPDPATGGPPPLLMFNGIGANLELAWPFLTELKGRRAIIFDVPGVGGSPLPALPYRPRTLARWAKGLCEALGYDAVDVSGVSWGGGVAQQFARQYPKICRKLVLAATSAGFAMVPGKPSVLSKMASFRRYTDRDYMRSIAAEIYGGDFRTGDRFIRDHAARARPQSQQGYLYQIIAMTGWTSAHWLWSLRQPTLVMSGTDDPLIPIANARLLATLIPDAELELVDNGHLFLVTRPAESAARIEAFLG
ncbi:MAG: poly(3-hydroxyalkanoate) depolymerase [Pseudomonadota bacterium]